MPLEKLEGYNTMLHRLFKKECEHLLKGLDYRKALIQKEIESRLEGSQYEHQYDNVVDDYYPSDVPSADPTDLKQLTGTFV